MGRHADLAAELGRAISAMPSIDCHEHTYLPGRRPQPTTLGTLLRDSDVGDDLIAAGMPAGARAALTWETAAPYLARARNTGFARSLLLALQDLFGLEGDQLDRPAWERISAELSDANARPGWYAELLGRRAGIRHVLRVQGDEPDPYDLGDLLLAPLPIFDGWVRAVGPEERSRLAGRYGEAGISLASYLAALDRALREAAERGAAGIKSMLAYHRTIAFSRPSAAEVAPLLGRAQLDPYQQQRVEDFLVHAIAERAGQLSLPYQMHVGYGSWQRNITEQANPLLLNGLAEAQRGTQLVLLHGGYPFTAELGTMAKNHPNVQIEAGWLAYIAPAAYRSALGEWLDSVPMSKITALGADCLCVEQTYGALLLTRRLLAQALAAKVLDDGWGVDLALEAAERLLWRNAAELYRLPAQEGQRPHA